MNHGIPEVRKEGKLEDSRGIPYLFGPRAQRREISIKLGRKERMHKQVHLGRSQVREALAQAGKK